MTASAAASGVSKETYTETGALDSRHQLTMVIEGVRWCRVTGVLDGNEKNQHSYIGRRGRKRRRRRKWDEKESRLTLNAGR